ncbi:hypothetical protein KKE06_00870 [Candidatus Micrarchaeota archaeon]|nr:hypothetical protein [Candidatus Micrarchaeota archaeon]
MLIRWSRHSKQRFAERAAKLGINYGEIELAVKKQKVKLKEGKKKFKTIFKIEETLLTAVKIETKEFIHVLTLWEANEKEVEQWKKK